MPEVERSTLSEPLMERGSFGSKYTDEQRRQACIEYQIKGSAAAVAKAINIPERTIADWSHTEWWERLTAEVRSQTNDRILAEVDNIIALAHAETVERLQNGNEVWDSKAQQHVRVKVSGKDAATIGAIAIDKRQILLNRPTSISSSSSEAIKGLAAQFEQLSRAHSEKIVSEQ